MDTEVSDLLEAGPRVVRRRIDVDAYYRMAEVGILKPDERVELIEGQIIVMPPISSRHHGTVNALNEALMTERRRRAVVSVQGPVRLDDFSEPEPDFALLRPRADRYRAAHPRPGDVLLLIEVALSSLAFDRETKAPLYALHGIPELWIVDVEGGSVEVHRDPGPNGYAALARHRRDEVLEPALLPGLRIAVADILG